MPPRRKIAPPPVRRSQPAARTRLDTSLTTRGTPADASLPPRDPGITSLSTVTAAMLVIVALAWVVGTVGQWWILIPVVAAALTLTAIVLATVIRLLDDGDDADR
jgi:hypothetical protein